MKPNNFFKRIYNITPEFIKEKNIKGMLIDMDNTILPWDKTELSQKSKDWIEMVKDCGVKICIITNSKLDRTSEVMDKENLDYVHTAFKPLPFGFIKAMKKLGINKKDTYMIGDQMVTDALGAKLFGIRCAIVDPMSPKELKGTAINRFFERLLFGRDVRKTYDK